MQKISLIGAGNIGNQLALLAAEQELGEILLVDIKEGVPQGKALDLNHCLVNSDFYTTIKGSNDIADIQGSDIIIVTAGLPRTQGMSREDLIVTNSKIIKSIAESIHEYAPGAFVIVITNPLDIMTYLMLKYGQFAKNKVVGMAGELDGARFRFLLSQALKVHPSSIQTMILGAHSNSMCPMLSLTTVNGIPLKSFIENGQISQEKIDEIIEKTRHGGAEIVKLMGTSAYSAPAAAAIKMAKSYLQNQSLMMSACAYLDNQYGYNDLCAGVPVVIDRNGVKVYEIQDHYLSAAENKDLHESIDGIKKQIDNL